VTWRVCINGSTQAARAESTAADEAFRTRQTAIEAELVALNDEINAVCVKAVRVCAGGVCNAHCAQVLDGVCAHDKYLHATCTGLGTAVDAIAPIAKTSVAELKIAGRLPRLAGVDCAMMCRVGVLTHAAHSRS
jgi:hypothetical protein